MDWRSRDDNLRRKKSVKFTGGGSRKNQSNLDSLRLHEICLWTLRMVQRTVAHSHARTSKGQGSDVATTSGSVPIFGTAVSLCQPLPRGRRRDRFIQTHASLTI